MVISPPPSPTKRQSKAFPLFSRLLLEGLNCRRSSNPGPGPTCPATAPVLFSDSTRDSNPSPRATMADENVSDTHIEDAKHDTPITLQDPPKSKLKRQLSVDTKESQERLRIHKKPYLSQTDTTIPTRSSQESIRDYHNPTIEQHDDRDTTRDNIRARGNQDAVKVQERSVIGQSGPRDLHEASRAHKQSRISQSDDAERHTAASWSRESVRGRGDEVDGTGPTVPVPVADPSPYQQYYREPHRQELLPPRIQISPSKQYYVHEPDHLGSVSGYGSLPTKCQGYSEKHVKGQGYSDKPGQGHCSSEIPNTGQGYSEIPIKSPNLFDLNDMGLTSPFLSTTPRGTNKSNQVFVYPEAASPRPRKLSPYKPTGDYHGQSQAEYQYERIRHGTSDGKLHPEAMYTPSDSLARHMFPDELKRQSTLTAQQLDTDSGSNLDVPVGGAVPKFVSSSKGFDWSVKVTITQAIPMSPRVVTAEARPRYSSATATSSYTSSPHCSTRQTSRSDSYDDNVARLQRLEREYTRALEQLGCPEALRTQVLRSLSAVDRSPNEKSIRETREDVRNKYERMFSFPVCAPRISHYFSQQSQRDDLRAGKPEPDVRYQPTRPWLSDARRRLFARSESFYSQDRSGPPYDQDVPGTSGSADIPEEVLQFLHSKNFHPEELENLKDFLRRGGATAAHDPGLGPGPAYHRTSPLHMDPSGEGVRFDLDSEYRRSVSYDQHHGPSRERRRGDIDVRLSCESTIPSTSTQDMLKDLDHDTTDCRCSKIEEAIRQMALQAYSKIRITDTSPASFSQSQNEINETNIHVYNSMQFLCGIKCLCKYGRTLEEVYSGSVVFRLNCPNIDALLDLWKEYQSGALLRELQRAFVTDSLKKEFNCAAIKLGVVISKEDYYTCKTELEAALRSQMSSSPKKSPGGAIFHARSRSEPASVTKQANQLLTPKKRLLSPFRERFCSDSSAELSPRRAFQEINVSKDAMPLCSPSKKHENVFFNDENVLTSPKRHQFPSTSPQSEQENVGQSGSILHSPRQTTFPELPWSDGRNERVTNV